MNEYFRIHRLVPLWAALLITIPVSLGILGIAHEGFHETLAGGPLFLLFAYALAGGYLNRVSVRVNGQGVSSALGPVPLAPAQPPVALGDIVKVYVRHASRPTRSGSIPYLAAGVERADGRWLDLSEPMMADDLVRREAHAIAAALAWQRPVEELWGAPPTRDWISMRGVWYWLGAVLAGMAWGCAVEVLSVGR